MNDAAFWKRKGAERSLGFTMAATLPLALTAGWFSAYLSPGDMLTICATYYCAVALLARTTQ